MDLPDSFFKRAISLIGAVYGAIISYLYFEQTDPSQLAPVKGGALSQIWNVHYWITPSIVVFLILITWIIIYNLTIILPIINQFRYAKIYGLWDDKRLDKQIVDNFKKSTEIKVKLTRGYNTFYNENNNFFHILTDSFIRNTLDNKSQKILKILLHFPCQQSSYLEKRSGVNNITERKYVSSLYLTVEKLSQLSGRIDSKVLIQLRFYGEHDYIWRYFIFKRHNTKKILFLTHYDDINSGVDSPMLKIYSDATLCDDFDKSFNATFDTCSFSLKDLLISNNDSIRRKISCQHEAKNCEECIRTFRNRTMHLFKID